MCIYSDETVTARFCGAKQAFLWLIAAAFVNAIGRSTVNFIEFSLFCGATVNSALRFENKYEYLRLTGARVGLAWMNGAARKSPLLLLRCHLFTKTDY